MAESCDADEDLLMIADCEARESKLGNWERSFIESLSERLGAGGTLTEKQREKLNEIWERVT